MLRFTAKGRIQVWDGEVLVSSHVQEREAYERIAGLAPGKYTVTFPVIEVVSSGAFKSVYSTSSELGRVEARGMAVQVVRLLSDTTPPAVPSGFSASAATASSVSLTWTANGESDFSNYVIWKSVDGVNFGYLGSSLTNSYTDTDSAIGSGVLYYQISALDVRGNTSARTSAKSAGPYVEPFGWSLNLPSTITFNDGAGDQYFPFGPYLTSSNVTVTALDPASTESNQISATLPAQLSITSETPPRLKFTDSLGGTYGPVNYKWKVASSAAADFQSRISAAGVVWYHNFESQAEVNRFRWQGGIGNCLNDGTGDGSCTWNATGGPNGNGCMDITIPAGGTSAQGWVRPFSSLTGATNGRGTDDPGSSPLAWNVTNNTDYTGTWKDGMYAHADNQSFTGWTFAGNEFYIQFRCKLTSGRSLAGQPSGKLAFIGITGNGTSHITPIQEIVLQSNRSLLSRAYTNFGSSFNSALNEPQEANDSSGTIKQPGGAYSGTCINNISCAICGCYPVDEWFTVLVHIRPGHHGTALSQTAAQDTLFELKVAMDGDTDYTTVYSKSNYVISYRSGTPQGWNAFEPSGYMNNVAAIAQSGWTQSFAQVIFSTQPIACPQV